jgi:tetratricopeptide (TPR) repeat protein
MQATIFSGISLVYCGRHEEAVERFRRSLDIDPKLAPALLSLGMILSQLDRADEARPYLEKFLSLYPRHPMAARVRQSLEPR